MAVQLIERDGKPEFAVLPYDEYCRLVEQAEIGADAKAFDAAMRAIAGGEETVPAAVAERLALGENPVLVWREHRGLSRGQLCQAVQISAAYLSQIETGKREGTVEVLKKLAEALRVDLDDLV